MDVGSYAKPSLLDVGGLDHNATFAWSTCAVGLDLSSLGHTEVFIQDLRKGGARSIECTQFLATSLNH